MDRLAHAIVIASRAHAGQRDKGGAPYVLHPLRVMMKMRSEDERIVAVLHDVLEDGPEPEHALINVMFTPDIIYTLHLLTRRPDDRYEDYIERIAQDPLATKVKLADLEDNLDASRLGREPNEKDLARFARYRAAVARLTYNRK